MSVPLSVSGSLRGIERSMVSRPPWNIAKSQRLPLRRDDAAKRVVRPIAAETPIEVGQRDDAGRAAATILEDADEGRRDVPLLRLDPDGALDGDRLRCDLRD